MQNNFVGAVLAAGSSSRLGRTKALVHWNGAYFIERATKVLHEANIQTLVIVTQPKYATVFRQIRFLLNLERMGVLTYLHPMPNTGMGDSLQTAYGFSNSQQLPLVIHQVDRPFVNADHIKKIILNFTKTQQLTFSKKGDCLQPPAVVPANLLLEINQIPAKSGLKWLIENKIITNYQAVCFDNEHLFDFDLDTPHQLQNLFVGSMRARRPFT